ncbi:aldolase/citrate lyase family protein [Kaistia dalseonensis]|uniref:4-hydroxy-2-oxoheptanedioate aldolase n=1 Tax=Kaistia dalseonensis TaxID=410840 RepID=A0ABU0HDP0_9HYPH|nr:aldolase/citrate lyase family protein [Kaistia dalseonensis]MCX5497005.1 aldolase/citrate lyase family protein [Kaistia dalseonensis]MDQ0439631.1 4-hydroxy-2-oxoheptanedioate aldolase [Kaistia dalseonensis]
MPVPSLIALLRARGSVLSSWIAMPEPLVAESAARAGFDCVTLDMQHGLHDPVSIMRGIGAVALAGVPAIVRVPVGDFAMASRALDMGASAIIAPMINSAADAEALARATKYPPIGERSWGPVRAMQIAGATGGNAYLQGANAETLTFAMIETRAAVAALDEILAVPGIDAIFIGPSDLSIALSRGGHVDPMDAENQAVASDLLARAHAAGKYVGMFALTGAQAKLYLGLGYDFVALGSDDMYLQAGAASMLAEARAK